MDENTRYRIGRRVSWLTIIGNMLLAAVKAGVGLLYGSSVLIADAVHSLSDVATTVVVLFAMRIAKAPPDAEHPYGHGRAESIGAKVLAVMLFLMGLSIGATAVRQLFAGTFAVPGHLAIWVVLLSIVVKEAMYRYSMAVGRRINSTALIADALEHRSDAMSSVASLIGVVGARLGYPIFDPLAAVVVSIFIVKMGVGIFLESSNELMDAQVHGELVAEVQMHANSVPGVEHVDEVRIRKYGPYHFVDMKLSVDKNLTVWEGHNIASQVKSKLQSSVPSVGDVLVHVDPYPDRHDLAGSDS
jgi:cation diffusion facilitator family transporter